MSDTTSDTAEPTTDTTEATDTAGDSVNAIDTNISNELAGENPGVLVGGAHSVLIEPDHDTTPIPPADPVTVGLPLPQASTGSVDVAWEVLDVLTGPDGLL